MLVCTLPSPACMCSATNTRPCSTARVDGLEVGDAAARTAPPAKIRRSSARTSVFQETRIVRSCSRSKILSAGSRGDASRELRAQPLESQADTSSSSDAAERRVEVRRRATTSARALAAIAASACCGRSPSTSSWGRRSTSGSPVLPTRGAPAR